MVHFLPGAGLSIADLALYSVVNQLDLEKDLQPELARWFKQIEKRPDNIDNYRNTKVKVRLQNADIDEEHTLGKFIL